MRLDAPARQGRASGKEKFTGGLRISEVAEEFGTCCETGLPRWHENEYAMLDRMRRLRISRENPYAFRTQEAWRSGPRVGRLGT
jgi:hypothetical protein